MSQYASETYKRRKDVNENIESNYRSLHPKACFQIGLCYMLHTICIQYYMQHYHSSHKRLKIECISSTGFLKSFQVKVTKTFEENV